MENKKTSAWTYLNRKIAAQKRDMNIHISHYTGFDSLLNIISTRRLRASNVLFMNDPLDGYKLYFSIMSVIDQRLSGGRYHKNIREYNEGNRSIYSMLWSVDPEILKEWNDGDDLDGKVCKILSDFYIKMGEWWFSDRTGVEGYSSYVICFTESSMDVGHYDDDDLVHWRAYGRDGKGVRIEFGAQELLGSIIQDIKINHPNIDVKDKSIVEGISIYRCEYMDDDNIVRFANEIVNRVLNDVLSVNSVDDFCDEILYKIVRYSILIKSHHYKKEDEIRMVLKGDLFEKNMIKFKPLEGMLSPFIEFGFDLKSISRITCGPNSDNRSKASLEGYLYCLDEDLFQEIDVGRSKLSYEGIR